MQHTSFSAVLGGRSIHLPAHALGVQSWCSSEFNEFNLACSERDEMLNWWQLLYKSKSLLMPVLWESDHSLWVYWHADLPHASCCAPNTLTQQECVAIMCKCEGGCLNAGMWFSWIWHDTGEAVNACVGEDERDKTIYLSSLSITSSLCQHSLSAVLPPCKWQTTASNSKHSQPINYFSSQEQKHTGGCINHVFCTTIQVLCHY